MSWFLPLAMMGAGVLKNELVDRPRSQALAKAEAAKTMYSPWTGMQGQTVMPPSSLDAAMKWGLTGLQMKQQMPGQKEMLGSDPIGNANMSAYNTVPQRSPWSIYGANSNIG